MGNSIGCSASGERLVSAARDGDLVEAKMLLEFNPGLAKYSTFGGLNSPLHFAAAKGHSEIVALLLENGADVNSRNYCGQTALMQACRHGHWEVVQTLLVFGCNVTRADYLSGRTALHFAAVEGHVRCIRLLVADFIPSMPFERINPVKARAKSGSRGNSPDPTLGHKYEHFALSKFINKPADGGITALHMAVLNGYADCAQLLLDLGANVSAVTFHYGSSLNLIGSGSTPLHYAACGGNIKCCQMLLARGASRLTLNCNGWLPLDVARIWRRHSLEPLLAPNALLNIPPFPLSNYLSLPLMSILNIARDYGLQLSSVSSDEGDNCAVCLERACRVAAEGCRHEFCVNCALCLCSTSNTTSEVMGPPGSIPCPLCRNGIVSFIKLPTISVRELKPNLMLSFCNPCILQPTPATSCKSTIQRNRVVDASSEITCPLTCSPFPSVSISTCTFDDPCLTNEETRGETTSQSSHHSGSVSEELDKMEDSRLNSSCSGMFWSRRNCHREHQCNAEINA